MSRFYIWVHILSQNIYLYVKIKIYLNTYKNKDAFEKDVYWYVWKKIVNSVYIGVSSKSYVFKYKMLTTKRILYFIEKTISIEWVV